MEAISFAKIVERHVRKALKAEGERGECREKTQSLDINMWLLWNLKWPADRLRQVASVDWVRLTWVWVCDHSTAMWTGSGQRKSLRNALWYTPIKLITALQMIKPEGHSLLCVCVWPCLPIGHVCLVVTLCCCCFVFFCYAATLQTRRAKFIMYALLECIS